MDVVMTFELPESVTTATQLRELEQNAPKTTPKEIRAALLSAAQQLERWEKLGTDAARQLEEAANLRISEMATTSRVSEIQSGVRSTMLELARAFRELA
jgi:hypothetical protein